MLEWKKLSGINEQTSKEEMQEFAQKRKEGAEKIANKAKEKSGPALLTYHHFKVKIPYYSNVANGLLQLDKLKKEYVKYCKELHSHMEKIEEMNQTKFQELLGKLEVIGELLIQNKNNQ